MPSPPSRELLTFLLGSALAAWAVEVWHYREALEGLAAAPMGPRDTAALAGLLLARQLWILLPLGAAGWYLARSGWTRTAWALVGLGWGLLFLYSGLDLVCQRMIGAHIAPFLWFFYDVVAGPPGEGMKFAGGSAALAIPIALTVAGVAAAGTGGSWVARRAARRGPETRTLGGLWVGMLVLGLASSLAWSSRQALESARAALPPGSRTLLAAASALAPAGGGSREARAWLRGQEPEEAALLAEVLSAHPAAPSFPPPPGRRPHVVLLLVESWRADRGGAVEPSPMDPWWNRGLRLERHYSGSNTSHLGLYSLLYGRNPILYKRDLDAGLPPLFPALLRSWGYETLFLSSTAFQGWKWQERFLSPRFFDHLEGAEEVQTDWREWPQRDRSFLRDLPARLRSASKPVLAVVFLQTTHFPYAFPPEFARRQPCLEGDVGMQNFATADPAALRNRYGNACDFVDSEVAAFLEAVDLEDTVVVLTGDHGESFREDGTLSHGTRASEAQLRVPGLVVGGGVPTGRCDAPTTHADLLPTVVQHLRGARGDLEGSSGRDLLHLAAPGPVLVSPLQSFPPYELVLLDGRGGARWRVLQSRLPRLRPDLGPDADGLGLEFAGGVGPRGEPVWEVPAGMEAARSLDRALREELGRLPR